MCARALSNEEPKNDAPLKLLKEDESPVKLRVLEEAKRLKPDLTARAKAKSHEPQISEIIEPETAEVQLESVWGEEKKKKFPVGWLVLGTLIVFTIAGWVVFNLFPGSREEP